MTPEEMKYDALTEKCTALEAQNEKLKETIKYRQMQIDRLNGIIEGLKFAIRCNGVSGGEVTG